MVNPGLSQLRRSILFCDFVPPVHLSVVLDLALSPALSGWGGVRAGRSPGCRGPSLRSWCQSPRAHRCVPPPPRFSPVSACEWR